MKRFVSRMMSCVLAGAIYRWIAYMEEAVLERAEKERHKGIKQRVVSGMRNRVLASAFNGWLDLVAARRQRVDRTIHENHGGDLVSTTQLQGGEAGEDREAHKVVDRE